MTRKEMEIKIIEMVKNEKMQSLCDECSKQGFVSIDPYYWEIKEQILIKSLCNECYRESVNEI